MINSVRAVATPEEIEAYRTTPQFGMSVAKLAVLAVCSFGLYEIYWSYKQWDALRRREHESLMPFWRAFFAPLWGFSLFSRVQQLTAAHLVPATWSSTGLGLAYLVIHVSWRLPDPYWLVSMLSFIPLLVVQRSINALNAVAAPEAPRNDRYSAWNIVLIVVGGLFVLLAILGTLLPPLPPEDSGGPLALLR